MNQILIYSTSSGWKQAYIFISLSQFSSISVKLTMHPDGNTAHETKSSSWFLSPGSFYNLPAVNDFIIDILLGSPSGEVNDTFFFVVVWIDCTREMYPKHGRVCLYSWSPSLPLSDPPCSLWSALHPEPVGHFSLPWHPETQLVPPPSGSYCSAATVESNICHERGQPEVI